MLVRLTRLVLPLLIGILGVVMIVLGGGDKSLKVQHEGSGLSGIGIGFIIIALMVWMINWMYRMSVQSNRERDVEEEARRYFEEHGRWPDE